MNREHVVQIGFSFDEDKIVQTMTENLERKIGIEIEKGVRDKLFGDSPFYGVSAGYEVALKEWLTDHKDEVIKRTAELLVEKLYRTKAVKEMVKKVGDEL